MKRTMRKTQGFWPTALVLGAMIVVLGVTKPANAQKKPVLTVTSFPSGALVLIDGVPIAQTPASLNIALGTHTVVLQPGPGWDDFSTSIVIGAGQNSLSATLHPSPGPSTSVSSAVDHVTGVPGNSIESVPEESLTPLPAGATTRRVMVLNAVLRSSADTASPIVAILPAFINSTPVGGAYPVTVWDPSTGAEFDGSGPDVLHLEIASFFSP